MRCRGWESLLQEYIREAHSSGVVSVVVTGLLLGHKAPVVQTAQSRIAERINWRTIAYFLENTVFLLIGLQAQWILQDVGDAGVSTGRIVAVCAFCKRQRSAFTPISDADSCAFSVNCHTE